MKRSVNTFNTFAKILLFIIGLIIAVSFCIEWEAIGRFSVSMAHSQLERRGMRLSYSDVTGTEGGFTIHNLRLNGIANVSFSSLTVKPKISSSILSLSAVGDISFKGGSVQIGQVMNFGDGSFLLTAGTKEILIENLRTNGDFSINGFITIDPATMKIGRTEARLNIPEDFSRNMDTLKAFLPLVQDGDRWFLRRK